MRSDAVRNRHFDVETVVGYTLLTGVLASLTLISAGLARMEAAEDGNDDPLEADIDFHVSILRASGNPFYLQFRDVVATALRTSIRFTNRIKGHTASIPEHGAVRDLAGSVRRVRGSPAVQAFLNGIQPAVVGLMFAAAVAMARHGIQDWMGAAIAVTTLVLMRRWRLHPLPVLLGASLVGLVWRFAVP